MAKFEIGPIYDPDDAEKLVETYLEHGDLMGWRDKQPTSEQYEEGLEEEAPEDE